MIVKSVPIKRFYMVRHGETESNAAGITSGSFDTPLTERGREQARAVRPVLQALAWRPEIIAHSHLSRARDTAMLLNGPGLPMIENSDLAERDFGNWVGEPWKSVCGWIGEEKQPPKGEARETFIARAVRGISDVLSSYERALIVSHGGIFDALAAHFDCAFGGVSNCSFFEFSPKKSESDFPWDVAQFVAEEAGKIEKRGVTIKNFSDFLRDGTLKRFL